MPSVIRVLDELTVNQIAAGEVIENPASVVKELVENAMDAGATSITVECKGGGRRLIRVIDDGCGMSADDALLALERHATSKIQTAGDLAEIVTMGFRGEALPSIASIGKCRILTRHKKEQKGTLVLVEGGRILQTSAAAASMGTTIEVKSLFYNVPVRKKFQRSPSYDAQGIHKVMILFALGNPAIHFELIHNQETLLTTHATKGETFSAQLEERIQTVLGGDSYYNMCPLKSDEKGMQIEGFIGHPSCTRQNRTGQYLFINKRAVFSPMVSRAVKEGYGTAIPTHRFPVFVLHVTLPGDLVDVNVHPQKREVRFRRGTDLRDTLFRGVDQALQGMGVTFHEEISLLEQCPSLENVWDQKPVYTEMRMGTGVETELLVQEAPVELFDTIIKEQKGIPKVLATMKQYILLDPASIEGMGTEGVCFLDQRLAHARIIFEKWKGDAPQPLEVQPLLIPYTFEVNVMESSILRGALKQLHAWGIQMEEFGEKTFVVHAFPISFGSTDIEAFIRDLIHQLQEHPDEIKRKEECCKQLALAASRAAISRKQTLSVDEAEHLVADWILCEQPRLCPLGKPTLTLLTSEQIAGHFHG